MTVKKTTNKSSKKMSVKKQNNKATSKASSARLVEKKQLVKTIQSDILAKESKTKEIDELSDSEIDIDEVEAGINLDSDGSCSKESYYSDVSSPNISLDEVQLPIIKESTKVQENKSSQSNNDKKTVTSKSSQQTISFDTSTEEGKLMKEINDRKNLIVKRCVHVGHLKRKLSTDNVINLVKDNIAFNFPKHTKDARYLNRGFGFIHFANEVAAQSAVKTLNSSKVDGKTLVANIYRCNRVYNNFKNLNLLKLIIYVPLKEDVTENLKKSFVGAKEVVKNSNATYCVTMPTKEAAMALFKEKSRTVNGKEVIINFFYDLSTDNKLTGSLSTVKTNKKRTHNDSVSNQDTKKSKMTNSTEIMNKKNNVSPNKKVVKALTPISTSKIPGLKIEKTVSKPGTPVSNNKMSIGSKSSTLNIKPDISAETKSSTKSTVFKLGTPNSKAKASTPSNGSKVAVAPSTPKSKPGSAKTNSKPNTPSFGKSPKLNKKN